MLVLSRTGIRNLATDDTVYSRGLQYYKSGRVSNVAYSKTSHQYRMTVRGNYSYNVTVTENEDGSFEHSCNCPSHVREKGACKHVVAALFFLLKYQEKSTMEAPQNPDEQRVYQILEYFANQSEVQFTRNIFHIYPTITLRSMMRGADGKAFMSLMAGGGRYYKVQLLKKFLMDYAEGENIALGKEFQYIATESEFDRDSVRLLDFLLNVAEIQNITDHPNASKLFFKQQLSLSKRMLLQLLHVLEGNRFNLELYGQLYENTSFVRGNPEIKYDLDVSEDAISLDYEIKEPIIPLTESGEILFYRGVLYEPDRRFLRNYVPFYNNLGREKNALIFRGENKQRFLEEVLPKLHSTIMIEVPDELKGRYLHYDLEPGIYFDIYNDAIKAELRFGYGEYEFNCFEEPHVPGYIIVRQPEKEKEIMRLLEGMGFEPHSSFYILKDEGGIFSFLQGDLGVLSERCSLFYSNDFKKLTIRSSGKFHIGLRVSKDIDLLEMDLSHEGISQEELHSIFRSFQLKKKYYRLKDGSFLSLDGEDIRNLSDILENLNVTTKQLNGQPLRLDTSSAFFLEDVLRGADFVVEKNDNFELLVKRILNQEKREFRLPQEITAQLRPYQVTGFEWMKALAQDGLGGILADDMGLGKTLQAISYITSQLRSRGGKYMVICPSSLVYNWQDEFEKFSAKVRVAVCNGAPADRQVIISGKCHWDVVITSYPLLRRDVAFYQKIQFDTIFIDEAQFIKNATSQSAQSVKLLKASHRFALTGTPVENSLSELWSIFDFLMPGYLMSHAKFVQRFEKKIMNDDKVALAHLNSRVRPFILRRMKKDVLHELPEKIEEKIVTEMTEEQKKIYLSYMASIRSELNSEIAQRGMDHLNLQILAALTRLRQICCHPSTFLGNYSGGSGKLELLLEILDDALANGHRVLIFSQFTSMLKIIQDELIKRKMEYFYLDGSTSAAMRLDYVKRYNGGEKSIFLISLKAGGTGLNLTGADTVIHYDPWWNPAVEDQATDRAYRIGQKNTVHVMKLLTKGTIEEKIFKLQEKKKNLSDSVIKSKEVFVNKLTREELNEIFSL